MAPITRAISSMDSFKVLASTTLQISISNMRVSSASARWKAKASKHGWMGDDTKATSKTARKMAKAPSIGLADRHILAVGVSENSMASA